MISQVWSGIFAHENEHICPLHLCRFCLPGDIRKWSCPAWMRRMECFPLHLELGLSWWQWRSSLWYIRGFSGSCSHILVKKLSEELISGSGGVGVSQVNPYTALLLNQVISKWLGSKPMNCGICINCIEVGRKLLQYRLRDVKFAALRSPSMIWVGSWLTR